MPQLPVPLLIFCFTGLLSSCKPAVKVKYYANGRVQFIDSLDRTGQSRNYTYFRADGTLEGKIPIQHEHIQGLVRWYDAQGRFESTEEWASGHQQGLATTYYLNGQLKSTAEWVRGQKQGLATTYYRNGKLKVASHWVAGKRTGVTRWYSPTGVLRESSTYLADSLNGLSLGYTLHGVPQFRSYYTNGKRTGRGVVFGKTGKPAELHCYDATGALFYVDKYRADGKPSGDGVLVPLITMQDTVLWKEKTTGFIKFGYPLKTKATLLVGTLGNDRKALEPRPLLDTIQVVEQSRDGRFYFVFYPARVGASSIGFKFLQPGSPWDAVSRKDSLAIDNLTVTQTFFVRKPTLIPKTGK